MKQKKLIWQIFPANLLILALTVVSVIWFGKASLKSFYLDELEKDLVARANLIKSTCIPLLEQADYSALREMVKDSGRESHTRITLVLKDGRVIADSNEDPTTMESHHDRVEIKAAYEGRTGKSLRHSRTLGQDMLYVAIPLSADKIEPENYRMSHLLGVLRMSVPVTSIEVALQSIFSRIFLGVVIFVLLAAAASLLVSRNISKPLELMERAAERFSTGDFSQRMTPLLNRSASLEVLTLAASMDRMAEDIDERIRTIEAQRKELDTVFSSMVEAVIAVDCNERIIDLNDAAADLFGVSRHRSKGRIVQEVLRDFNLQQQISQVLTTGTSIEDEIVHYDAEGEQFLQSNLVSLRSADDSIMGVLVVMNDVTRLRRLENVRRDFVANVSHELRTPITSIRGYVETLLDPEVLDNREDSLRFLETILRQAERLNEIIEDLLALSRIEQEAEHGKIMMTNSELRLPLAGAVDTCLYKAEEAGVEISLDCPDDIRIDMNSTLMEQAVINLLVNGIRYSPGGSRVEVNARLVEEAGQKVMARIDVVDHGIGIGQKHLPRLFERFYRSDKARSRKHGGTGLGLAIVKHIVLAHDGRIDVYSKENEGSTFSIYLPVNSLS